MIEMEQKGLNDAIKQLKETDMNKVVDNIMDEAREICEDYTRGYCSVDTGELLESIYSYRIPNGFVVGASADHAVFNEYGSITTPIGDVHAPVAAKKVGVRPFIRPAILRTRRDMQQMFGGKLQELISHG